jgi:hypothetical protein
MAYDQGMEKGSSNALLKGLVKSMQLGGPLLFNMQVISSGKSNFPFAWQIEPTLPFLPFPSAEGQARLTQVLSLLQSVDPQYQASTPKVIKENSIWRQWGIPEIVKQFMALANDWKVPENNAQLNWDKPLTLDQIKLRYGAIPWDSLRKTLLSELGIVPVGFHSNPSPIAKNQDLFYIKSPAFFDQLYQSMLQKMNPKLIRLSLGLSVLRELILSLEGLMTTSPESIQRNEFCHLQIRGMFPLAYMRWIHQGTFTVRQEQRIYALFSELKYTLGKQLDHIAHWDNDTKMRARSKLSAMTLEIGLPKVLFQVQKLVDFYSNLPAQSTWIEWIGTHRRHVLWAKLVPWMIPALKTAAHVSSSGIGSEGIYFAGWNRVYISQFSLLSYSQDLPETVLYATTGSMLGHEIAHGLFYFGRYYNQLGGFEEWWTPQTGQKFEQNIIRPLIRELELDRYVVNDFNQMLNVRGEQTKAESVSDLVGLSLAYLAWKAKERFQLSPLLFGVSSPDQVFFLSYAQRSCASISTREMYRIITSDTHPPHETRVNLALRNFPPFALAYKCNPGQNRMCNPAPIRIM